MLVCILKHVLRINSACAMSESHIKTHFWLLFCAAKSLLSKFQWLLKSTHCTFLSVPAADTDSKRECCPADPWSPASPLRNKLCTPQWEFGKLPMQYLNNRISRLISNSIWIVLWIWRMTHQVPAKRVRGGMPSVHWRRVPDERLGRTLASSSVLLSLAMSWTVFLCFMSWCFTLAKLLMLSVFFCHVRVAQTPRHSTGHHAIPQAFLCCSSVTCSFMTLPPLPCSSVPPAWTSLHRSKIPQLWVTDKNVDTGCS